MSKFRFQQPVTVYYSDLDPQWHVNNSRFLTYVEHARINYLMELGIFDGHSFWEFPLIVADIHIRYLKPIELQGEVIVSIGVTHIGNKSLLFECEITGKDGEPVYATVRNTMVAYDYHAQATIPVSDEFREKISRYEGKSFMKGE